MTHLLSSDKPVVHFEWRTGVCTSIMELPHHILQRIKIWPTNISYCLEAREKQLLSNKGYGQRQSEVHMDMEWPGSRDFSFLVRKRCVSTRIQQRIVSRELKIITKKKRKKKKKQGVENKHTVSHALKINILLIYVCFSSRRYAWPMRSF